jgi:hypothetical protein
MASWPHGIRRSCPGPDHVLFSASAGSGSVIGFGVWPLPLRARRHPDPAPKFAHDLLTSALQAAKEGSRRPMSRGAPMTKARGEQVVPSEPDFQAGPEKEGLGSSEQTGDLLTCLLTWPLANP